MPAATPSSQPRHQRRLSIGSLPATPTDYLSPSTRRHAGVLGASPAVLQLQQTANNNDAAEKRERRKSRLCDLQVTHSPCSPSDNKRVSPLNGLSTSQLTDHYSNCIKLSTENKINSKNAFGLHLIDYMSDLMRKKEMTNFQVASSTLDASTKIYAGRVDAIHTETYKVLSSLGVGADRNDKADEDGHEGDADDGGDGPERTKKEKRIRRGNTIETNTKKIDIRKVDLEFQVDPFFQKMSAAFDEGGSGGLLLNHLCCYNAGSELTLDSNTVMMGVDDGTTDAAHNSPVDMRDFMEMYQNCNVDSLQICPAFADFEFMKWDEDSQMSLSMRPPDASADMKGFTFDLDAEPEPCDDAASDVSAIADEFGHMAMDDDDGAETAGCETSVGPVESMISSMRSCTVSTLVQALSTRPSEYSYFKQNVAGQWSGPGHWKLRPHSSLAGGGGVEKKTRVKKAAFFIDYSQDETTAHAKCLKAGRAATTLTKTTLARYSRTQTTLPEQLSYDAEKLLRVFLKPSLMVTRTIDGSTNVCGDDGVDSYDYNNAQDRDNFCPLADVGTDDDDDDNDHVDASGQSEFGANFNATTNAFDVSEDVTCSSGAGAADGSVLASDNLVAQPTRVAKMNIAYAKVAKRYDMKLLKSTMWKLLAKPHEENKENENSPEAASTAAILDEQLSRVYGEHRFSSIIHELSSSLPKAGSHKPSVHIAFACLLHLANEKNLTLRSEDNLHDISIVQS